MSRSDRIDEEGDKALAEELVFSPCGLMLYPIPAGSGKTPDYWILKYAHTRAYCELKSPRDDELIDALEAERARQPDAPAVAASIIRNDDKAARNLASQVKSAVTQFNALNKDHTLPNVLLLVNHASGWNAGDLHEALTGYFHADDGKKYPTELKTARQIGPHRIEKIDLYIWIDREERKIAFICNPGPHDAAIKDLFLPILRQTRTHHSS